MLHIYIYIYIYDISSIRVKDLTFILLTWRKWLAPNNASRQQMAFNSGFKGLMLVYRHHFFTFIFFLLVVVVVVVVVVLLLLLLCLILYSWLRPLKIRIIDHRKMWTCCRNSSIRHLNAARNYMAIIYTFHENVGAFALVQPSSKKQTVNLNP